MARDGVSASQAGGGAANSRDAQVERLVRAAERAGLTVYSITVEPKRIHLVTQPLGESSPTVDAADEWLAAHGSDKASRRA